MIYLSGKISAKTPKKEQANKEVFNIKEKELTGRGLAVHNCTKQDQAGKTWEEFMVVDLLWIIENKPIMYMMKGWEDSVGARLEHALAIHMDLGIVYE